MATQNDSEGPTMSAGQRNRVEKIARLRKFFGPDDRPEIYEWGIADLKINFTRMSDREVVDYLKANE
jgi:hypothetical protein